MAKHRRLTPFKGIVLINQDQGLYYLLPFLTLNNLQIAITGNDCF